MASLPLVPWVSAASSETMAIQVWPDAPPTTVKRAWPTGALAVLLEAAKLWSLFRVWVSSTVGQPALVG